MKFEFFLTESLWHLKYSYLPPFAPPFHNFLFSKRAELHILPESKNQLHMSSGSKDTLFQSKNIVFAEIDQRGGKI